MQKLLSRQEELSTLEKLLKIFPITAILGPRQTGKTVLAKQIRYDHFFDLENPRDLERFKQPQLALEDLRGTIVIDEIQRLPDIFPLLRHLVDQRTDQKYLILGSASRDLIRQSSESLAGRIAYFYLSGFKLKDVRAEHWKRLWLRGGFPRAYLSASHQDARLWLENYITNFLERDIPQLGISIPSNTLRRFWKMISHYHGQTVNYSEIGRSFGVSDMTVRKYLDILEGTFMIRLLAPWHSNTSKRLVKSPKLYIRDSGIFHILQAIDQEDSLASHPKIGASWEGFALESVTQHLGKSPQEFFFWATHSGAELDLFWQDRGKNWGIEFKYSDAPSLTPSMQTAVKDLHLDKLWVLYPGKQSYRLSERVTVAPLWEFEENRAK